MICTKCNYQNEETAKFCRNCGVELNIMPQKQSSNVATWVMSVLFVLAFGAFIFTWTQYVELDAARNLELKRNSELREKLHEEEEKLSQTKEELIDLKRRINNAKQVVKKADDEYLTVKVLDMIENELNEILESKQLK